MNFHIWQNPGEWKPQPLTTKLFSSATVLYPVAAPVLSSPPPCFKRNSNETTDEKTDRF